jgi:uncharacterized repeat protein (TIGR04076 family)
MSTPVGFYKVVATVTGMAKNRCRSGHKIGDVFEISSIDAGGLCGWLYHDLFPHLVAFQHGGSLPWWKGDVIEEYECPDRFTQLKIRLERHPVKEAEAGVIRSEETEAATAGRGAVSPLSELVMYGTEDLQFLHGLLWEPERPSKTLSVYIPGGPGGFAGPVALNPIARILTDNGYALLAVNMRTAGMHGFLSARFEDCVQDIGAAVRFARERGYAEIILVGDSLGGCRSAYYWAKTKDPCVRGLVFVAAIQSPYLEAQLRWSAKEKAEYEAFLQGARELVKGGKGDQVLTFSSWHPNRPVTASALTFLNLFGRPDESDASIVKFGPAVTVPALVLHGTQDNIALPENAKAVHESLTASPRRDLRWVDGGHFLVPEPEAAKYAEVLVRWLLEAVPPIFH